MLAFSWGCIMNEFTKEELEEILTCICVMPYCPNQNHLVLKLNAMIKNYCAHEKPLDKFLDEKIQHYHKTCLTDLYDNGCFWAYKDVYKRQL